MLSRVLRGFDDAKKIYRKVREFAKKNLKLTVAAAIVLALVFLTLVLP